MATLGALWYQHVYWLVIIATEHGTYLDTPVPNHFLGWETQDWIT